MFPIPLAFFNEFQSESMMISYFNGEDCGVGMGDGDGGGDGGWGRHLNFPPPLAIGMATVIFSSLTLAIDCKERPISQLLWNSIK